MTDRERRECAVCRCVGWQSLSDWVTHLDPVLWISTETVVSLPSKGISSLKVLLTTKKGPLELESSSSGSPSTWAALFTLQ